METDSRSLKSMNAPLGHGTHSFCIYAFTAGYQIVSKWERLTGGSPIP